MIFASLILGGCLLMVGRAIYKGQPIILPELNAVWLLAIALLPQLIAFHLPFSRTLLGGSWIGFISNSSYVILLLFIWRNQHLPGLWLLTIGVGLNFMVMFANGGFMPITPETVTRLVPDAPPDAWQVGQRLWAGKDIVLPKTETFLWWLSDCLVAPNWVPLKIAFSLGDVLIAGSSFWVTRQFTSFQKL